MRTSRLVVLATLLLTSTMSQSASLGHTQKISADDTRIQLSGRFDLSTPNAPKCAWTGSAITITFKGKGATALFTDVAAAGNYFNVIIDDSVHTVIGLVKDSLAYPLAYNLSDTIHTLTLFKRTEPSVGAVQFHGFKLAAQAKLLTPKPLPQRRIEFIGNSITCGYGNETPNEKSRFSPATENGFLAYSARTARNLNAEYRAVAWSGKGMYRNLSMDTTETLPYLYQRTLPVDTTSTWDHSRWAPQVICINLGTNDFNKGNPTEAQFSGTYRTFIAQLRTLYPTASIFCLVGSMMSDSWPKEAHALTTIRTYLTHMVTTLNKAGDEKIYFLEFNPQNIERDGVAAHYHPSLTTHQVMATKLTAEIKEKMQW